MQDNVCIKKLRKRFSLVFSLLIQALTYNNLIYLGLAYHGQTYSMGEDEVQEQDLLVHAVRNPNLGLEDVARLLAAGVDPNLPDSAGRYALHEAVRSPKLESVNIVWLLLEKKADPEIEDSTTPFYVTLVARNLAFEQRKAKVLALIKHGARVKLARTKTLLDITRIPYLAGEYYPGEPATLFAVIKKEVIDQKILQLQEPLGQDCNWNLTA